MTPRRPQQSLDNRAEYDRQRKAFEGVSDITTRPPSEDYRKNFDRIDWKVRQENHRG